MIIEEQKKKEAEDQLQKRMHMADEMIFAMSEQRDKDLERKREEEFLRQ